MAQDIETGRPEQMACREKYWNELTADEKIERMREEVKSLQSRVTSMSEKVDELFEHQHYDGRLVIPLSRYSRPTEGKVQRGAGKDETYF